MRQRLTVVASVCGGLVAGLLGSIAVQSLAANQPQKALTSEPAGKGERSSDWIAKHQEKRVAALEERLAALQGRAADESEGEQPEASQPDKQSLEGQSPEHNLLEAEQKDMELNPEEGYRRAIERWDGALAEFDSEPFDPEWAPSAASSFDADLRQFSGEHGFQFVSAECRTTSCAAKVVWKTHAAAVEGFSHLLHHHYPLNCGTQATLPEPAEGTEDQPYEMTVLYDCTDTRSGG
jgi:hypothetical protein